ncbi:MAG: hypothetical protein WEF50_16980 [Myxococcota bacterium]
MIRWPGAPDVQCYGGTARDYELMDATLADVPPDHLLCVVSAKFAGFRLVDTAGLGGSRRYTGGLNPEHDDRSTTYDERQAILITYGALWENRALGICPTVFHEIGHVMTHAGNGLGIAGIDAERDAELRAGAGPSRNPGALEPLCNAYMYLLCYGSADDAVRAYGSSRGDIQRDRRTRDALRRCPAFARLPAEWQARLGER